MAQAKRNFNSIKVRLEQGGTTTQRFLKEFQFHKGAIRTSKPPIIASLQQDFNSIKVRLERKYQVQGKEYLRISIP